MVDAEPAILDILDTAGQEEYSTMREQYMKTGEGFVLVYSINSRSSFEEISSYLQQILRVKDVDYVPCIVIGNKSDLETERQVSIDEGQKLANQFHAPFLETSAKRKINVEESFHNLIRLIRVFRINPSIAENGVCLKTEKSGELTVVPIIEDNINNNNNNNNRHHNGLSIPEIDFDQNSNNNDLSLPDFGHITEVNELSPVVDSFGTTNVAPSTGQTLSTTEITDSKTAPGTRAPVNIETNSDALRNNDSAAETTVNSLPHHNQPKPNDNPSVRKSSLDNSGTRQQHSKRHASEGKHGGCCIIM